MAKFNITCDCGWAIATDNTDALVADAITHGLTCPRLADSTGTDIRQDPNHG